MQTITHKLHIAHNASPFRQKTSVYVQTQENKHAKSKKWHSSANHIVHKKDLDVCTSWILKQCGKTTENICSFQANSNETRNFTSYEEIIEIMV